MPKAFKIKPFFGTDNDRIIAIDLHSEPLDGADFYPKILPSSVREKIVERADKRNISELVEVIDSLIRYQGILDRKSEQCATKKKQKNSSKQS